MRFDQACFVAPKPKVPSIPTRRAFLIAGGLFTVGTALGGACGYSAGYQAGATDASGTLPPEKPTTPEEIVLKPSGDIELDELRRLAVKAPLDDLFAKAPLFLSLRLDYQKDEILWLGIARIATEIVNNPQRRVAPLTIEAIITTIGGTARPASPSLHDLVPALRARKAQEQRK